MWARVRVCMYIMICVGSCVFFCACASEFVSKKLRVYRTIGKLWELLSTFPLFGRNWFQDNIEI